MEKITIPDNMETILQTAIKLEEDGYKYYTESAQKIKNSLGKRMLERLAGDEKNHIKRFTEIYNAITNNTVDRMVIDKVAPTTFDEIFNRLKEQLDGAVEDMQVTGVDDEEIIEMALDLEKHTQFFYTEAAKKTSNKKIAEFLDMLAKEELGHYNVLRKSLEFLEDPSLFFGMGASH
ncbi:MAG: ferritin family protein [Calditrichaceae bacterium]|nr:ferritin family protein [Calditrichaceae bacterium]MBN2710496.1 ferritin family protein [Calditrichaceae bacterium]RQV97287.1 MAG: hypothetical protein EH224_01715 [Calditrichota bacterium]